MKKKLLVMVLSTMILFSSTSCGMMSQVVKEAVSEYEKGSVSVVENEEEQKTESNSQAIKPGNYLKGGNLKFTFEKAVEYDKIEDGLFDAEPDPGKKYLVLFFDVENVSDEDLYVNMFYWDAYADDYEISQETLIVKPDDYDMLSGDLAVGKKMKGYICYQVDKDWEKLEATYTDGILDSNDKYEFIVTPKDLS